MKKIDSMNFRLSYYEDSYKFIETMKKKYQKSTKKNGKTDMKKYHPLIISIRWWWSDGNWLGGEQKK